MRRCKFPDEASFHRRNRGKSWMLLEVERGGRTASENGGGGGGGGGFSLQNHHIHFQPLPLGRTRPRLPYESFVGGYVAEVLLVRFPLRRQLSNHSNPTRPTRISRPVRRSWVSRRHPFPNFSIGRHFSAQSNSSKRLWRRPRVTLLRNNVVQSGSLIIMHQSTCTSKLPRTLVEEYFVIASGGNVKLRGTRRF